MALLFFLIQITIFFIISKRKWYRNRYNRSAKNDTRTCNRSETQDGLISTKMHNLYRIWKREKKFIFTRKKTTNKRNLLPIFLIDFLIFFFDPRRFKKYINRQFSNEIKLIWFTNNIYKFYFIEYNLFDHCINYLIFIQLPSTKQVKNLIFYRYFFMYWTNFKH